MVDQGLLTRALSASNRWAKRELKKTGTVPTWSEWDAWVARWISEHSQSDAGVKQA